MKSFALYFCLFSCHVYGITALYNLALGTTVQADSYDTGKSTSHSTGNFTDGDRINTCKHFSGYNFYFYIQLPKTYSVESSRLIFRGNFSTNITYIQYWDDSYEWPFYVRDVYRTEIPHTLEFDIQRTGGSIYFNLWGYSRSPIEFELCEIEVYGCEVDHYGSDCQLCNKSDNCEVCDVNNGACYICRENYTGPNCSINSENVALQRDSYLYYNLDVYFYQLPSYLLFDGSTTQPSCIDSMSVLTEWTYNLDLLLLNVYNIKEIQFFLTNKGTTTVRFNYTIQCWWDCSQEDQHTGIEEIPASSSNVITIPYPKQASYLYISIRFFVDDLTETFSSSLSICEVEVKGCPRNHYGSPCRPCSINCDQCNAIDGSCVCQAGYTGGNCTHVCSNGTYGANCVYSCGHCFNDTCDHVTGNCLLGCTNGWTSSKCNQACSRGRYGRDCSQRCSSHCITPNLCDRYNGSCQGGCATGWTNDTCDEVDTDYCIDWAPSDVSVYYHNVTWRKEELNNVIRYDPAVTLLCNFSLKSDEKLFYDITWFIDRKEFLNQTVDETSNYTAVTTAHDILKAGEKMGSEVHCKVGAKRMKENFPCLFKVGNPFFAGIKIINPSIELERKGSKNVELEMTIPFASESLYIDGVPQPVSDLNIHMTFKTDDSSTCSGGGSSNQCEVKVKSYNYDEKHKYENDEWRQNISFPVYSQDTDGYVINSQMTLRLKTGGTNGVGSKIFEHVSLPDISISVREGNEQWKGRSCGVRADPHMYTFDGKSYECQIPGEFINYRNEPQLQWIQSKHHLCFPSYDGPWCICAVAARAGRDVFVMDLCGENKVISYELCEDNVLKVTKIHDKYYKIYFPTGTSLAIYIMEWSGHYNIDLEILPSAMDVGNADGLCGYFDGVRENDFRRRNATIIDDINLTYPNDFSMSWTIPDNENLFNGDTSVYNSLQSVSTILVPHCKCTESGKTECSYNTFTPCNSIRGKQYKCNVNLVQNRRRKRDVSDMVIKRESLFRKKRTISHVRSYEYSETVCLQAFENSAEYNTCQQHVTDLSNVTLSNCIEDIRMTGDDNLTQIHVEAALQQCSTFVLLNATLQESEPEVTYTIQNLCPSNCTGHGTCDGGNCTCDAGYGGSDCSFDLLGPPTITGVPSAGLCDLSTTACGEATILGKYFFENMDSICYVTVTQTDINQTEVREHQRRITLQERTLFEGYCPLPFDTTDIWTTEIKFNISNDGIRFTDTYEVLIYQSQCQEYHNESGNVYFTLKDTFCYIDSTCVSPMQNNSINECLYCNATNDKFNWTENESCGQTTTEIISTTILHTATSSESTLMGSTEQIKETTSSTTTDGQDETTSSQTVAPYTTAENEQTSLVSDTSSIESTLASTKTTESIAYTTTESEEVTENISGTATDTSTVLSITDSTSVSTIKASTAPETTTLTFTSNPTTTTTVMTTTTNEETTTSFQSSTLTTKTSPITSLSSTSPTSTTKLTTTTNKETSSSQPSTPTSETISKSTDILTITAVSPSPTTTFTDPKSTVSTAANSDTTTVTESSTRTSQERVDITTSDDTTDAEEESNQSQVKNTHLIVGVSSSVVGIVIIMIIVGLVARTCSKSNKKPERQHEDIGQFRDWRDLALAGTPNILSPQYNAGSFLPYNGDSYIPHAQRHHFKSSCGSNENSTTSRYQRY